MKEVICTCCPQGCHLQVDEANDYKVTGNGCPNGIAYGKEELTHPTRIITSTVRAEGCLHSRCPVKTSKPVPKGQMAEVVAGQRGAARSHPCGRCGADRRLRHRCRHCDLP
jgi:CxxC motif-containing protein